MHPSASVRSRLLPPDYAAYFVLALPAPPPARPRRKQTLPPLRTPPPHPMQPPNWDEGYLQKPGRGIFAKKRDFYFYLPIFLRFRPLPSVAVCYILPLAFVSHRSRAFLVGGVVSDGACAVYMRRNAISSSIPTCRASARFSQVARYFLLAFVSPLNHP